MPTSLLFKDWDLSFGGCGRSWARANLQKALVCANFVAHGVDNLDRQPYGQKSVSKGNTPCAWCSFQWPVVKYKRVSSGIDAANLAAVSGLFS